FLFKPPIPFPLLFQVAGFGSFLVIFLIQSAPFPIMASDDGVQLGSVVGWIEKETIYTLDDSSADDLGDFKMSVFMMEHLFLCITVSPLQKMQRYLCPVFKQCYFRFKINSLIFSFVIDAVDLKICSAKTGRINTLVSVDHRHLFKIFPYQ